MKNNNDLKKLYLQVYKELKPLNTELLKSTEAINDIISLLCIEENFNVFDNNNLNFEQLSNLFRYYEDILSSLYLVDEELYEIKFRLYIILIDSFRQLCKIYSTNIEKRELIEPILEILIESQNILKFRVPLSNERINTINNHIGENRYKFSHLSYSKSRELDNIFEIHILNAERIIHGFELSLSTNFSKDLIVDKNIEENIFKNNLSFQFLKMLCKIRYFHPNEEYKKNKHFKNALEIYSIYSTFIEESTSSNIDFDEALFEDFITSQNYLKVKGMYIIEEKLALLMVNTDEYKELIDNILPLK